MFKSPPPDVFSRMQEFTVPNKILFSRSDTKNHGYCFKNLKFTLTSGASLEQTCTNFITLNCK